jgi:hypothetical protein
MSDSMAITCPFCLRADERDSMVAVDIQRMASRDLVTLWVCRACAFAVAKAVKKTGELPPFQEVRAE